jgi:hypothetical protein
MNDERRGDAAFVGVVFVAHKGSVVESGPALADIDNRFRVAGVLALQAALDAALGVAAVVAHEKHQRVVQLAA